MGWLDSGRVTAQYQEIVKQALVGYPRDVAFEYRSADGQTARLQALAAELVQLKVDVVFAVGNQAIQAAKQATATVPIVMLGSDAVRRDDSSPNTTGVAYSSAELARGWLSLLKEIRPLSRVGRGFRRGPGESRGIDESSDRRRECGREDPALCRSRRRRAGRPACGLAAERAEAIIVPGRSPWSWPNFHGSWIWLVGPRCRRSTAPVSSWRRAASRVRAEH